MLTPNESVPTLKKKTKNSGLTFVLTEPLPVLVSEVTPGSILGEHLDTFLRQNAHIDLQAHERKHR